MSASLLSTSEERSSNNDSLLPMQKVAPAKRARKKRRPKIADASSNVLSIKNPIPSPLAEESVAVPKKRRAKVKSFVPSPFQPSDIIEADSITPIERPSQTPELNTPKKTKAKARTPKTREKAKPKKSAPKTRANGKKTTRQQSARSEKSPLGRELTGLVVFGATLLMALALVSYSAKDPGFGVSGHGNEVNNWVGVLGAYMADGLTLLLGLMAFALPLLLGAYASTFFRTLPFRLSARNLLGAALLVSGFVIMLHVVLGGRELLPFPAGGLLGAVIGGHLQSVLAPVGTFVIGLLMGAMGIMLLRRLSITEQVEQTQSFVKNVWMHAFDGAQVWREKRRMLWAERDELIAELEAEDQGPSKESLEEERKEKVELLAKEKAKALLKKEQQRARQARNEPAWTQLPQEVKEAREQEAEAREKAAARAKKSSKKSSLNDTINELTVDGKVVGLSTPPLSAALKVDANVSAALAKVAAAALEEKVSPELSPSVKVSAEAVKSVKKTSAKKIANDDKTDEDQNPGLKIVERDDEQAAKEIAAAKDVAVVPEKTDFQLPPLKLLDYDAPERVAVDPERLQLFADKLCQKFADFGIAGKVREVRPGPVCTTYEFVPAPGIKVSRIAALADDIAMAMEAVHVRIVAPIPGKGAVGIEIPNERRETVFLKEIVADPSFREANGKLVMALGKDIEGKPYSANLAGMPHVLISGTTGSGKSVSVNGMICSILYRARPDEVKFMMIDPKMLELSIYEGIPHLLLPPITDSKKASNALRWAVDEMERRYQALSDMGVRDLESFNERVVTAVDGKGPEGRALPKKPDGSDYEKFPYIVIVVDEYADLLAVAGKEVEGHVMRLAQKARAAGIHVMLATQRPSVDVITGVIKANFPVRMGFRLASNHDSKTIVNRPGAERLLGKGDMLIMPAGTSNLTRVHGAYISEKELHRVVDFLKEQGTPDYNMDILKAPESEGGGAGGDSDGDRDAKWDEAIAVVARGQRCSTSWLQRQLGIGYNRSARIVEMMEREGLIGPQLNSKGDRDIHIPSLED